MSLDDFDDKDDGKGLDSGIGGLDFGLDKKEEDEKEKSPSDALTIAGALGTIAGRDKFADVYFLVGTGKEQKRIPAHRVVLAASSDIFEAMLYPIEFPEDKDEKKDKELYMDLSPDQEIEIPDVKPSVFKTMLQCVYGDTAEIKAEELPDLIACAKKFQLEGLRLLCVTFMEEGVTVDNACTLFESAQKLLNEKHFALSFIEENAEEVVTSPTFETLSKERLLAILKSNRLAIDEIDLFQGILRWSVTECKRQNLQPTVENKRIILKDILPHIRFPTMTMEDIATHVSPSQMLDSQQLLEIFTYLGQPDKKKTISFNSTPRVGADKWMLDETLKSVSCILSNKNMTVRNTSPNHSYVLGTITWTKGQHAWRVTRDQGQTQWLLLGVSRKEAHQDASYSQTNVYALSSANQRYMNGVSSTLNSNFANGPLDVLLDCDKGECVIINLSNNQRHELTGLPKNFPFCPHFGPHANQQITVTPIRVREFGKLKKV